MLSEEEQLQKQRAGARRTALIIGIIALAIFLFTLYMNGKQG